MELFGFNVMHIAHPVSPIAKHSSDRTGGAFEAVVEELFRAGPSRGNPAAVVPFVDDFTINSSRPADKILPLNFTWTVLIALDEAVIRQSPEVGGVIFNTYLSIS
jgi:hypothetical protein